MEQTIPCGDFSKIIHSIQYSTTKMTYATNSVYIHLYDSNDDEIGYFMIDPSWRIVYNGKILQSSDVYPFPSNFQEGEDDKEEQEFYKWCSKTDFFRNSTVENINIHENGDIEFEWKERIKLQAFIFDYEDYAYYFYHIKDKLIYEIWFNECKVEFWEPKWRKKKSTTSAMKT